MKSKNIRKKIPFKWNSNVNLSDLINIGVILVAFVALLYQKKEVETKIDDLTIIVERLEKEEKTRELHDLKNSTKDSEDFSYNLKFSTNQIKALSSSQNINLTFTLEEINDIIEILLQGELNKSERKKLNLLLERNENKQSLIVISKIYTDSIDDFNKKYAPQEADYENINLLNKDLKKFNNNLEYYIDVMNKKRMTRVSEYLENLDRLEKEYIDLKIASHSR